ncbi:MAG: glycosyltransferase [Candidatus Paceibacterota bacterium]
MTNSKSLVSVIMTTYNAERFIDEAIQSILNQTLKNYELIIIDDCSKDNTWNIIEGYSKKDNRIRALRHEHNLGSCETLNEGKKMSRGDYIAVMDNDDWSYPDRIEKQASFLDVHPDVGLVGGAMEIMDENGVIKAMREYNLTDDVIRKKIFRYSPFSHPLIMYRRSVLEKVGFSNCTFAPADDYELYFRMGKISKFANLPDTLLKYRALSTSMTNRMVKKMALNTIKIRSMYKNYGQYKMGLFDWAWNLLHYFAIFLLPSRIMIQIYNKLRNSR